MKKIPILFLFVAALFVFACGDDITKKYYVPTEEDQTFQENTNNMTIYGNIICPEILLRQY